uniref:Uncharacterized protein n=1 Tax=Physcomitrium patens TaxID=3218 RepID=A0A2K1IXJ2_PHYPA|nr:hypothetical protein PHYPA_023816 [Physcomitrium patens]
MTVRSFTHFSKTLSQALPYSDITPPGTSSTNDNRRSPRKIVTTQTSVKLTTNVHTESTLPITTNFIILKDEYPNAPHTYTYTHTHTHTSTNQHTTSHPVHTSAQPCIQIRPQIDSNQTNSTPTLTHAHSLSLSLSAHQKRTPKSP